MKYKTKPPLGFSGLILAALWGFWSCSEAIAATAFSQTLFERTRPSVVEVLTKNKGNQGIAAAASGFLAHRQNLIVTNYHAVTEAIYEPKENELSIVTQGKERLAAQVIAVDVQHDLALLQLERPLSAPPLSLRETLPAKGESGFSMGKPGQYAHSIVGGTFNGVIDEDSTPQIIFSGAINPGMSGGPTMDAQGLVVGVNVATSTENQLLGLAVPAQALGKLIRSTDAQTPLDNAALRKAISAQFALFGAQQANRLNDPKQKTRSLGPFTVQGDLSEDKECNSISHDRPQKRLKMQEQRCRSAYGLYIMPKLYAGQIVTGSFWMQGKELSRLNLAHQIEMRIHELRKVYDDESPPGRWSCAEQRLRGHGEVPVQLHACSRPIEKLPGLYDYRFRYTPLIQGNDALVVTVGLSGFDPDTARQVLQNSIASMRTPTGGQK